MSGTAGASSVGVLLEPGLVCQRLKTYWKGSGRMRWSTFLWRREEERVRVGGCGLDCVLEAVVRVRDGAGDAITAAIEGYWAGLVWCGLLEVFMGWAA